MGSLICAFKCENSLFKLKNILILKHVEPNFMG